MAPPKKKPKAGQNKASFDVNKDDEIIDLTDNSEVHKDIKEYFDMIKEANQTFKIKFDPTFSQISESLKRSACVKKNDQKIVIAFFGAPGLRKSTTINMLINGNFSNGLLKKSAVSGEGCTKVPIRCRFTSKKKFHIICDKEPTDQKDYFEFEDEAQVINHLKDLDSNYMEATVEIPERLLISQDSFLRRIELIDLIGLPDSEGVASTDALKKNRHCINKEHLDCVFVVANREIFNADLLKHMWLCDIFSNLKHRKAPKLVLIRQEKLECIENFNDLNKIKDGSCRTMINDTLKSVFDVENFNAVPSKQNAEILEIHNKFDNVKEMCERSAAVAVIFEEKNNRYVLTEDSKNNLLEIIEEAKEFKFKNIETNNLKITLDLSKELAVKFKCRINSIRANSDKKTPIYDQLSRYLYRNMTYPKRVERAKLSVKMKLEDLQKQISDIYNMDDVWDYLRMEKMPERETVPKQSLSFIYDEMFEVDIIQECAKILHNLVSEIQADLKKSGTRLKKSKKESFDGAYEEELFKAVNELTTDLLEFKIRARLDDNKKDEFVNAINQYYLWKFNDDWDDPNDEHHLDLLKVFENFKNEINIVLDQIKDDIIDNVSDGNGAHFEKSVKSVYDYFCKIKEFQKSLHRNVLKQISVSDIDTPDLSEPPEPKLFNRSNNLASLKLPQKVDDYNLETCFNNKYIHKSKKKINAELFNVGKQKSKLKLSIRKISEEFHHELNNMQLETAIQIEIDRQNKQIVAELNEEYLKNKVNHIHQSACLKDSKERTLYPIFISSKIRGANRNENPHPKSILFQPNLLLSKISREGSAQRFLIFLCIEGGSCNQRSNFQKNIEFYLKCRKNEFEKVRNNLNSDNTENPIVLLFFPERELGIGRKRKIMMLIAEYFDMQRFYFIDDDIEDIYQYDSLTRTHRTAKTVAFNALDYMSRVLDYGIDGKDLVEEDSNDYLESLNFSEDLIDKSKKWVKTLSKLEDKIDSSLSQEYNLLYDLIYDRRFNQRDCIMRLSELFLKNTDVYREIQGVLFPERSKIIGQIALMNQKQYSLAPTYTSRLQSGDRSTHCITSVRYQVILYNLQAIKGIHPVSDNMLFELPLENQETDQLCREAKNKELSNKTAYKAAQMGYKFSDKSHVFYQILNGVSGYILYYYSFKPMSVLSKVDADEKHSIIDYDSEKEEI